MAAKRKPAIEVRPEGMIDDAAKFVYNKLAVRATRKGSKSFSKMEKIGGITSSVNPAESSPKKTVKQWNKANKKFTKAGAKAAKYNTKYRSYK
jgi:hypothetical protein